VTTSLGVKIEDLKFKLHGLTFRPSTFRPSDFLIFDFLTFRPGILDFNKIKGDEKNILVFVLHNKNDLSLDPSLIFRRAGAAKGLKKCFF
jgi:hypothetical protein